MRRAAKIDFGRFDLELLHSQQAIEHALSYSIEHNRNQVRKIARIVLDTDRVMA